MLELGKRQSLTVVKTVDFGVYLSEGEGAGEEVLLPKKEVPEGTKTGDQLEVFLYKDSKDRLIFGIVNEYNIRHNKADQKTDYSREIWYDWMMQYYTSTIITYCKLKKVHANP